MSDILKKIQAIKKRIKHGKIKFQKKKIKDQILKDIKPKDRERDKICKKARETAHSVIADTKRNMSNEIRKHTQTLSEGYDFIEESLGSGNPEFTFFEEPQESENITEAFHGDKTYGMIGVAEGVFAPIGVMSRNNRIYDDDHYDYLLENQTLLDKINNRGMLGTIGHHDKKVDDEDLAEGKVSHIVTDLHIQEEADGTRNLVGRLEILNTPAGNLLKTYYDSGMPLYVSSRGAGRLLPVANESYKRVDKTNYYLETFDIVRDPGFLGAKPKYLKESVEESIEENNNLIGENNMENEKVIPAVDTQMDAEEIVNKLLNPLQEQLAELTETVKLLSEKVLEESTEEVQVEEPVVEEKKDEEAEKLEADADVDDAKAEKLEKDAKEDEKAEEEIEEAKTEEVQVEEVQVEEPVVEEKKDEEAEKLEADADVDDAKAEKLEKDAKEDKEDAEEIKEGCDKKEDEAEEDEKCEECGESTSEETIDYEAKFKESEAVMNDLVKMVSEASERSKALVEKYEAVVKELNAYKLSEELSITIDEAKEKLETKSYEEIKEEAEIKEETEEPVVEEIKEPVQETKKPIKSVFSRFSNLNESKKSNKKGFSIFG